MRKIRIAQIGTSTNSHGNDIFNTLKNLSDVFEVVGYALPENEREKFPERMADFEGYREMTVEEILNDPEIEAVTVETEELYLVKYATLAAKHGKHIHMEKPGGIVLSDFENLIKTVKEMGKTFHMGYMYRYNQYVREIFDKIESGELGDIISIEAQMNCIHPVKVREWLKNFKGGMMFFLGCHLIDLILQMKGQPDRIIPLNKKTGTDGVDAEDFGMAIFEYKDGVSFVKTIASEIGGYARRQFVVTGTKKTVELKPFEMFVPDGQYCMFTEKTEYESTVWSDRGVTVRSDIFNRYNSMMTSFAQIVAGEKQNPYSADYELELYKTLLICCGVDEK
ncbi:MAG: Gfo/Idh/MocA family oxidoreductase [Clostridia bacterium]|nr:Gfo/Idh/MocA family oxidoreductase [Clostridia bacterium]